MIKFRPRVALAGLAVLAMIGCGVLERHVDHVGGGPVRRERHRRLRLGGHDHR